MLFLHLGFHKTASTHFQEILLDTPFNEQNFMFIGPSLFREYTQWKNGQLVDSKYSGGFLKHISSVNKHVILSEENICGDSFDIFKQDKLYENLSSRLNSMVNFFNTFDEIELFLVIRNPVTYIPSIYCEALRWRAFQKFNLNFDTSWVPVITNIMNFFPSSKINVFLYEDYSYNLPIMLNMMGVEDTVFERNKIVRPSFVFSSIKLMGFLQYIVPKKYTQMLLGIIDNFMRLIFKEKFQPFNNEEIKILSQRYNKDIEEISALKNVNLVSRC